LLCFGAVGRSLLALTGYTDLLGEGK